MLQFYSVNVYKVVTSHIPNSNTTGIIGNQIDINSLLSIKISNDQELIQSDPTSCPQNQKGNNK